MKRLAAAACAAAVLAGCGEDRTRDGRLPEWASGPSIEVIGRAYIEVPPNRARFSVTFEEKAPTSAEASAIVIERAKTTAEAVREIAEGDVLITSNLDVEPYYEQITRRVGEFEEEIVENEHPDALLGYVASASLDVTVLDPDRATGARGAALAASPTYADQIYFYLEPSSSDQRAAFHAAAEDAQDRARLAAEATGKSLGRPLLVQEGDAQCLGYLTSPAGRSPVDPSAYEDFGREKITVTGSRNRRDEFSASFGAVDAAALIASAGDYALAADPEPQRVSATVCAVYAVR